MKLRYTFRGLFVVITIVASIAAYIGIAQRRGEADARFNRAIILIHSLADLIGTQYNSDAKVPDNVDLRFLLNKYNGERNTGPVKDPWGKVLHVKTFNNGTLAMVYSDGEDRIDNHGERGDLSAIVCMIHNGPRECNCSLNPSGKVITHYSQYYAKVHSGLTKAHQGNPPVQPANP